MSIEEANKIEAANKQASSKVVLEKSNEENAPEPESGATESSKIDLSKEQSNAESRNVRDEENKAPRLEKKASESMDNVDLAKTRKKLVEAKKLLDDGLIDEEEYAAVKKMILGQ